MALRRLAFTLYLPLLGIVCFTWTGTGYSDQTPAVETVPAIEKAEDGGVILIGDFYIDRYEYPNRRGSLPRVSVTWTEAQSLCRALGKRLCTEAEWERAARPART